MNAGIVTIFQRASKRLRTERQVPATVPPSPNFEPERFGLTEFLRLLAAPNVTDLVANGPTDWQLNFGTGFQTTQVDGCSSSDLAGLCRKLVDLADRHLDLANPICDVSLTPKQLPQLADFGIEALRVHAVLESSVSATHLLSVRVHRSGFTSLDALGKLGMFDEIQRAQLFEILHSRQNFLIAGSAGSGKTTLLRAMLAESPQLRTLAVEDTAELLPIPGHVVGLQARQANIDGKGEIPLQTLAQQALRMQPQRLVVGEVRGAEVDVLLQAMNTGHAGSAATIHANSASAVFPRLRGLAPKVSDSAFRLMAHSAVQKVIYLSSAEPRRIESIGDFEC
jgi:pilus assembly protein CpaF